ncbi:hypothetical protein [Amycolatopsis decaplanina]|nr:hypothetical protein [Amycolatopsis decaplanina]
MLSGRSGSVAEVIGEPGPRDVPAASFGTGFLPPLVLGLVAWVSRANGC